MQFIFLLETQKVNQSDYIYIHSFLNCFYQKCGDKYSAIYMNGKCNYNKKEKQIQEKRKKYVGDSEIFICVDVDCVQLDYNQKELNRKIENYASQHNYHVIWFKGTIEEVFCGEKISNRQKTMRANRFLRTNEIQRLESKKLEIKNYDILKNGESNIKYILDNYLKAK
ncbi:MAG: hypothetical protein NC182_02885 [Prevotella sp.]|nr:hypothetical protein [Staphylococcus sp.]MCM1350127.1 hypothetical protein [Prevotella sp.]